jgi:hypothetical protein
VTQKDDSFDGSPEQEKALKQEEIVQSLEPYDPTYPMALRASVCHGLYVKYSTKAMC